MNNKINFSSIIYDLLASKLSNACGTINSFFCQDFFLK